jgi:tRNA1(Val) A37 N6-methylase TrmN6
VAVSDQPLPEAAIRADHVLGGRVKLLQRHGGYRPGLDAALLAACDSVGCQRVLEAGCGVGGALLAAAVRQPGSLFVGVERDLDALALAQQNVELNGLGDRVQVVAGDVDLGFRALGLPVFDAVMANPPFFDDPQSLRAPALAKAGAYMADSGLKAWAAFMLKAVREGGAITLIHRADRLADILGLLAPKAGSFRVRPIHPFADQPAKRVLVRAIKTGKAPLALLPPLVLHDRSGAKHTPETEAILRGEADLGWE